MLKAIPTADRPRAMDDTRAPRPGDGAPAIDEDILSLLLLRSVLFQERVAMSVREGDTFRTTTYGQLEAEARRVSDHHLERGVGRGSRAAILGDSGPSWVIAFFACVRAGAVVVPLDPRLTEPEILAIVADAAPEALFVSQRLAALVPSLTASVPTLRHVLVLEGDMATVHAEPQDAGERKGEETALIVYTSGTTGEPKGVMVGLGALVFEVRTLMERSPMRPDDVFLSVLPLHHLLELTGGLLSVLYSGGEVCYARTLMPSEALDAMRQRGVTRLVAVPLFLRLLRNEIARADAAALPPLRSIICGGAPLDRDTEAFFEERGVAVFQGYGLTECSPVVAVNAGVDRRPGSVGRPLRGVTVRIDDPDGEGQGEVLTRGPNLMQGYFRRPDLTAAAIQDGWLHTGDLGRLDGDGFLYVTGRQKNLIVLGSGKKVQPEEVEAALARGTGWREVCVVGVCARTGLLAGMEEVCAVVATSEAPGDAGAIEEEVAQLAASLAPHKRPRRTLVYPGSLPRTAAQKLRRAHIAQWAAQVESGTR